MRRWILLGLAGALIAFAAAGTSMAGGRARTAKAPYSFDFTKPGATAWFGQDYGIFFGDAVVFKTRRAEAHLDVVVADDSGKAVTAGVWQEGEVRDVICGDTEESIPITGGKPVYVQVFVDATFTMYGGCPAPEVPTTGTVTATFTSH